MTTTPLVFGSYREIAAAIAERLLASRNADALAPWGEEVIVASGGVAQSIHRRIALPSLITPSQSLESLALRVVNAAGEYPRIANDAERRMAMRAAARTVADPLMETHGTAAMLERTYRDVRDSGLTVREFARRASAASVRNRERVRTIVRAWDEYERLITKLGCVDPADVLGRAVQLIAAGANVRPQIVAGFYDMTGAQLAFISALRAVEKLAAVYVPVDPNEPRPYAFASTFVRHFVAENAASHAVEGKQAPCTIREYKTREEEIRGVCASVRALLDRGVAPADIGIVARSLDPYDIELFERYGSERAFATTATPDVPLVAHRIGRAVATLLRLRERDYPRSEVLEIARSGLKVRTKINVDKADMETRRESIAGGSSAALRARRTKSFAVADYIELVAELEEWTERIDGRLIARLADSFRIDDAMDLAACAELDSIADLFIRAEVWGGPADAASILDALAQSRLGRPSPVNGPRIWLGDVMRFRGRSFQHVFAVRMQDDVVPQRRNDDPLLPDADRRLTGVREIGNGRDEEQLLFHLMRTGSTSEVIFSYASSDGFGKPLRPSHYLRAFVRKQVGGDAPHPAFGHLLPAPRGEGAARVRPLQLLARAGHRSQFDGYITTAAVLARARAALEAMSPTQLEDFGECPQKFLLKHILRVRDLDDPEREVQINHREKGSLDHRILERFYRSLTADDIASAAPELPRVPQHLAERLEATINEQFDEFEQNAPPHNPAMRAIERRATLRILRRFVASDFADLIANGLMPAHFEYKFGSKYRDRHPDRNDPYVVDVDGVALRVEGTIDRVDRGDTRLRIVDYKSGKALRHEALGDKIDRGVRLQLALYAAAAADFFAIDPSDVAGTIKPLAPTDTDPESFAFSLGEKRARLNETLHIFVRAILRGAFPAFPNQNDREFNSCKYCPVNHSCRTRHDADERRIILGAGEPRTLLQS